MIQIGRKEETHVRPLLQCFVNILGLLKLKADNKSCFGRNGDYRNIMIATIIALCSPILLLKMYTSSEGGGAEYGELSTRTLISMILSNYHFLTVLIRGKFSRYSKRHSSFIYFNLISINGRFKSNDIAWIKRKLLQKLPITSKTPSRD